MKVLILTDIYGVHSNVNSMKVYAVHYTIVTLPTVSHSNYYFYR